MAELAPSSQMPQDDAAAQAQAQAQDQAQAQAQVQASQQLQAQTPTMVPDAAAFAAPVAVAAAGGATNPIEGAKRAHSDFVQWLYQPHGAVFDENVGKMEASTGMKREHLAYAFGVILSLYLIAGSGAQLVCNMIGFGYPCYASVKAVRSTDKGDDTQWLIYWTVFATFSLFDFFAVGICSFFPIYWLLKAAFLVYLYLPQTQGAQTLYTRVVDPLVTAIDGLLVKQKAA